MAQQAVMQVLQRRWDRTFSDSSYGFRPGRSTHQAVANAQQYIAAGHGWVVDLDLEKFFDRVNHDKLMGQIAKRVRDKRLLKLIRALWIPAVTPRSSSCSAHSQDSPPPEPCHCLINPEHR